MDSLDREEAHEVMIMCVDSALTNFKYQLSIVRMLKMDLASQMFK